MEEGAIDLANFILENGPFVGYFAFSQGGYVMRTLNLDEGGLSFNPPRIPRPEFMVLFSCPD